MKGVGMLVVSHRGVNFGFWSHLACSGNNVHTRESFSIIKESNELE